MSSNGGRQRYRLKAPVKPKDQGHNLVTDDLVTQNDYRMLGFGCTISLVNRVAAHVYREMYDPVGDALNAARQR